ncbi:MAG: hypothetical protein ACI8UO_002169 [Verrucomicrobiales bacterium]|jgi:hypothetical protein
MSPLLFLLWIPALDPEAVQQHGSWGENRFRYAETASAQTNEDGATLELSFEGTGAAIRLGANNVPAYGAPNLGLLIATIDGGEPITIHPRSAPRELVLADGLPAGVHKIMIRHTSDDDGLSGCRIEGFRTWSGARGGLEFHLSGEENAFLVDARAILRKDGGIVRNSLIRNWLTGQCSMTGLEPGEHTLEIVAAGWNRVFLEKLVIRAGESNSIPPIYLQRDDSTVISRIRFPALNRQAIRKPGETFRARFLGYKTTIDEVVLTRRIGPAVISRKLEFEEDEAASHYYDREVIAKLPSDIPPGLYDLSIQVTGGQRPRLCRSSRSVHVVAEWPADPVLVTFGHLDTSAQFQAEYLERIADMANLAGADFVLQSTAVNPAYISGSLARLEMPYLTNFGNHQFYGHEKWFGDPVERVDYGPDIAILNFGHLWFDAPSIAKAQQLLAARPETKMKIINAFEANAPLEFLDQHQVRLIHDAHGLGEKVMEIGTTPTLRVGKTNSLSFRIIRFENNRVVSAAYNDHPTAPIPFGREDEPPLKVEHSAPNDGTSKRITTTVSNSLLDPVPNGRVTWVMPLGEYQISGGRFESNIKSDAGRFSVVSARVDIPEDGQVEISVEPK